MLAGHHVLCFGPDLRGHTDPDRVMRVLRRMVRRWRMLYIPSLSSEGPAREELRGIRNAYKARFILCGDRFRQPLPGLSVFQPPFVRCQPGEVADSMRLCAYFDIASLSFALSVQPTLLWTVDPVAAEVGDWLPGVPVVYQVDDALERRPHPRDLAALALRHERLLERAAVVLAGSRVLYDRLRARCDARTVYLPHPVDVAEYRHCCAAPRPAPWPRPAAGVLGPLTRHHDVPLLVRCAGALPDVTFVVMTPEAAPLRRLLALPNVRRVDPVDPLDPQALPRLVAGFDVGLVCTRPCSWLAEGHPKELLPFLAAGRPVVSTPVPEVLRLGGPAVSVAADFESFAWAIRRELASDEPARRPARIERAAAWDWSRFEARLGAALPAPPAGGGAWTEVEFAKFVRASVKPPVEGAVPPLNPPDRDLALHFAIMQSQLGRLGVA